MKQIILYGLSGADQQYRVVKYWVIFEKDISISNINFQASIMKMACPNIEAVYAVDNRPGLKQDFVHTVKKNTIENCAIFKDILERSGIRVI